MLAPESTAAQDIKATIEEAVKQFSKKDYYKILGVERGGQGEDNGEEDAGGGQEFHGDCCQIRYKKYPLGLSGS